MARPRQFNDEDRKERAKEAARKYREQHRSEIHTRYEKNKVVVLKKNKQWRQENRDKKTEADKKYREANREKLKEQAKEYRQKNRDRILKYLREWYHANKDYHKEARTKWYIENRERASTQTRQWRQRNPERVVLHTERRRFYLKDRTPKWADLKKIKAFYLERDRLTKETGVKHEVDHIIPLCSEYVCGLHVETNLRVLTATENRKKFNNVTVD